MSILILLLMLILFGFAPYGPVETTRVEAPEPAVVSLQAIITAPAPLSVDGQPATALAIEPMRGEATYAVSGTSLYRADGHGGWQLTGTSPNLETTIVDSRNPDVLWAGTGEECYRGGGVPLPLMHSTDAGATWTEAGPAGYVPLASWNPGNVVIAHDCSGLQVSMDSGATWAMPQGLPLGSQVTAFAILSSPESAAGLNVLVGVTGEGGTSQLYKVSLGDPAAMKVDGPLATWFAIGSLAIGPGGSILLGAPQGVLRSDDGGATWTTLRAGLESTTLERDPIEYFPSNVEPNSFGLPAMVVGQEHVYVAGVDGIYRLAGEHWEQVAALDAEVTALAIEPGTGAVLAETSEQGVQRVVPAG